jgi:nucleotide-binding universal stress UspA family protein
LLPADYSLLTVHCSVKMTLSTILCPLDFSAASAGLVAYAAALAVSTGAELRLLHVCESPEIQPEVGSSEPANCLARLDALRTAAEQAGAPRVQTGIVRGDAAVEIVAEAQRQQADVIVIGAHGQTGITRFLMGNTAEVVMRTAACPTLLFRAALNNTLAFSI